MKAQGHGEKKNRQWEQAIVALLKHPTIKAAAKACGVGEVTLWRWLQDEEFQQKYSAARKQAFKNGLAALQNGVNQAVESLLDVMNDGEAPHSARVSAARGLLEMAFRASDSIEVEERLQALESRLDQMPRLRRA